MGDSIYCACGAQWHGKYTTAAVVADHVARARGRRGSCLMLTHREYVARFRCKCADCRAARRLARLAKRGLIKPITPGDGNTGV